MKKFTLISHQYSSCGYREDDWQIIATISNEKELYEALKEGYLQDARNRNNYPLCSHPIYRTYTYEDYSEHEGYSWLGDDWDTMEEEGIVDLRGIEENNEFDYSEIQNTLNKFEKWKKRINSLIPKLREKKRKIDTKNRELNKLFELANKYGYQISKKDI